MHRPEALSSTLDAVAALDSKVAVLAALRRFDIDGDPWELGLASFASFMAVDFRAAADLGDRAIAMAHDDEACVLAFAARALAGAGWRPHPGPGDSWELTAPGTSPSGDPHIDAFQASRALAADGDIPVFLRYLIAEAALACGRLDLAAEVVAATGEVPATFLDRAGLTHPFRVVMVVMRARLLAFRGRIADAVATLADANGADRSGVLDNLVAGTRILLLGNTADRAEVRALSDRLDRTVPAPSDYLSAGCHLLAAFGLVAVGDVRRAAQQAFSAGGSDLERLTIVDRGLTLELLVAAAVDEDDLDAAEAWRDVALPLADSPIAGSTAARLISRVELAAGRVQSAVEWADRGVARARAEGRGIEAAEGEIVAARARLASSGGAEATSRLGALVELSDQTGHLAARRSAARELRLRGRRLRPVSGSEWDGLSDREQTIALYIAHGLSNREVARELHLSQHTVRAHVSRVLAAFGAASRFAVAARVAETLPDESERAPLPPLTTRQDAVADRITLGQGNAEIGRELGVTVKTVEKHVTEILRRWSASSRLDIARMRRRTE